MDGIQFGGMEGFLQGLKVQNKEEQKKLFLLQGIKAYRVGQSYSWNRKTGTLYYDGQMFSRYSEFYTELVRCAYTQCAIENEKFREALIATKGKVLKHSIGYDDITKTILTEKEFVGFLTEMRELL